MSAIPRRIAVLGGGQLGRMMALAGVPLGFSFRFLDPAADACAGDTGELVTAGFDDQAAARELAANAAVVTFDFENVPAATAEAVEESTSLFPPPAALQAAQDRLTEKTLFDSLDIAVGPYHAVSGRTDLLEGLDKLAYPAVLKTRRLGYDGKGQVILRGSEDLEHAWQKLGDQELILEAFVGFEAECSIIAVRGQNGETRFWPLTRNVHNNGILALSLPGVMSDALQHQAEAIATKLLDHFQYVGVLTIEFFLADGRLLVNEMAPRVHNSGHWTIDGAVTSQFENHVRAVAGLPLGDTSQSAPCMMFNWIGEMPDRSAALQIPGLHWHDYGKQPRPGRKIGHATVTAGQETELIERVQQLAGLAGGAFEKLLESSGLE